MTPSRPIYGGVAATACLASCLAWWMPQGVSAAPAVQAFDLAEGMELVHMHLPGSRSTSVLLVFPGGPRDDPEGMEGLAELTLSMLLLGARDDVGKKDALALYTRTADLGAATVGDHAAIGFTTEEQWLDGLLRILGSALDRPDWSPEALDRRVEARWAALEDASLDPSGMAWLTFQDVALGERTSWWAAALRGRRAPTIRTADARRFHEQFLRPSGAVLLVAGPEPADLVARTVERTLLRSGWEGEPVTLAERPARPGLGPPLTLVHRPDLEQARVVVGAAGPGAGPSEMAVVEVLGELLAGDVEGRLNRRLRRELRLSYGVSARMLLRPDRAAIAVEAAVVHDDAVMAVREILAVLGGLASTAPPLDGEVRAASARLRHRIQYACSSPEGAVDVMASLLARGMPPYDVAAWLRQLGAVEAGAAGREAVARLSAPLLRAVIVGDADRLEGPLRAVGFDLAVLRPDEAAAR